MQTPYEFRIRKGSAPDGRNARSAACYVFSEDRPGLSPAQWAAYHQANLRRREVAGSELLLEPEPQPEGAPSLYNLGSVHAAPAGFFDSSGSLAGVGTGPSRLGAGSARWPSLREMQEPEPESGEPAAGGAAAWKRIHGTLALQRTASHTHHEVCSDARYVALVDKIFHRIVARQVRLMSALLTPSLLASPLLTPPLLTPPLLT